MARRPSDAHHAFGSWLAEGAPGEPPRAAALHASVCAACLRQVAALDALGAIDLGSAMLPASRLAPSATRRSTPSIRWAGAAAGVMGVVIIGVGATQLLGSPASPAPMAPPDRPAGAVLGATGTPLATPSGTPTATATPPSATRAPATPPPALATQRPPVVVPTPHPASSQPSATPSPTTGTPSPTPAATSTPLSTASPTPAATPTPAPTASPTTSATATPAESATPSPTA